MRMEMLVADRHFRFSQTTVFMASRLKYYRQYIQGLERSYPVTDEYRPGFSYTTGTIAHAGLEAHYLGNDIQLAMVEAVRKENVDPDDPFVAAAYGAVERFLTWLETTNADAGQTTIAIEDRIEVCLGDYHGDTVYLNGQPDRIFRDAFGLLHVDDWKFVDKYSSLASYVGANRQLLTYALLAGDKYGQVATSGILTQITRKPLKTKAFIPAIRSTTWISPLALQQHTQYLNRIISEMVLFHQEVEAGDTTGAYPNPTMMCSRMCGVRSICCESLGMSEAQVAAEISVNYKVKDEFRG